MNEFYTFIKYLKDLDDPEAEHESLSIFFLTKLKRQTKHDITHIHIFSNSLSIAACFHTPWSLHPKSVVKFVTVFRQLDECITFSPSPVWTSARTTLLGNWNSGYFSFFRRFAPLVHLLSAVLSPVLPQCHRKQVK